VVDRHVHMAAQEIALHWRRCRDRGLWASLMSAMAANSSVERCEPEPRTAVHM